MSNSVLWKCSEESSATARIFRVFFLTLLIFLIIITISFAAVSLVMAFCNYQKFNKLISHYYIVRIKPEFWQHVNFFGIAMTLHSLFQQKFHKVTLKASCVSIGMILAQGIHVDGVVFCF